MSLIMKKKDLEIRLQRMMDFTDPVPSLEQYMTPSVIASDILFTAYSEGDIKDMDVIDPGCGTGMLSIGASLLGAGNVYGYDISETAVSVARGNAETYGADVIFDIRDVNDIGQKGDTVVMNPPFGCQTRRADRAFLDKAMELCGSVYSVHMASSEGFLDRHVLSSGREICFRRNYRFNIPHTFRFHSKANHVTDVVMIVIR